MLIISTAVLVCHVRCIESYKVAVGLSACLCLAVCMYECLSVCLSVCMYVCVSVCLLVIVYSHILSHHPDNHITVPHTLIFISKCNENRYWLLVSNIWIESYLKAILIQQTSGVILPTTARCPKNVDHFRKCLCFFNFQSVSVTLSCIYCFWILLMVICF